MDLMNSKRNISIISAPAMQHSVFEIILLVIVAGLFYWFIVAPKQVKVNAMQNQGSSLEADFNSLEQNEKKFNQAIADMKAHKDDIADLDEALPLDNRATKLQIALGSLTQSSGMVVGDISIAYKNDGVTAGNKDLLANPYKNARKLQRMTTSLDVTGTYDQFQGLLQKLEQSGRILTITGVEIVPTQQNGLLNFKVTLEAYYYE